MVRKLSFPCSLALALGLTAAITSPAGAAGKSPPLCPEQPIRVAVLGDSLADGVWGSLYRSYIGCETVTVLRLTTVSDGLAKTPPDDWLIRLSAATGDAGPADVVIVQMGANDLLSIREGTSRAVWGAPGWDALYQARARQLTERLASVADQVFWLGLPVVGTDKLEAAYTQISTLQADAVAGAAAASAKAEFFDIHTITKFGADGFTQNAEVNGELRQVRAGDQVHFTEAGYDLVRGVVQPGLEGVMKARDATAAIKSLALQ